MKRRAEHNTFLRSINFPHLPELGFGVELDYVVEVADYAKRLLLNFLRRKPQLGDQTVNLVYEKNRLHPFLKCLANDCLGLSHNLFHSVNNDNRTVNRPQRPRHLASKIYVSRRVHQVYQISSSVHFMQEGYVRGFDGDPSPLLLF